MMKVKPRKLKGFVPDQTVLSQSNVGFSDIPPFVPEITVEKGC